MLSGHVHGGQVRVPVLGPLFIPSRFSRKYDGGCYRSGSTLLYVSRGLSGREPLRWNCRPEVTRIRLVKSD
jgi:predicted MPP superfamily phosphohydrolase